MYQRQDLRLLLIILGQIVPHLRLKEIQAIVLRCLLQRQVIILTSMLWEEANILIILQAG